MNKLNCTECVKTSNHCCLADIPIDFITAVSMLEYAKDTGMDISKLYLTKHPKFEEKGIIIHKDWVDSDGDVDISNKACVFLQEGKCSIYEYRPDICRWYGTDYIRCRWEASSITPEQIARATIEDIKFYDDEARIKSKTMKAINNWRK